MSYPGHHINEVGKFDSDLFPDLPPDLVAINVSKERNWPGLLLIADAYQGKDAEFADDLRGRVLALAAERNLTAVDIGSPSAGPMKVCSTCGRNGITNPHIVDMLQGVLLVEHVDEAMREAKAETYEAQTNLLDVGGIEVGRIINYSRKEEAIDTEIAPPLLPVVVTAGEYSGYSLDDVFLLPAEGVCAHLALIKTHQEAFRRDWTRTERTQNEDAHRQAELESLGKLLKGAIPADYVECWTGAYAPEQDAAREILGLVDE